jgi:hypothetical protein
MAAMRCPHLIPHKVAQSKVINSGESKRQRITQRLADYGTTQAMLVVKQSHTTAIAKP